MAKLHTATLLTVCVFFLLFNNEVLAQQECTTDNANYIDLENDAYSCATQSSVLCEDKSQVILSCPVLCTSCGVIEGAEGMYIFIILTLNISKLLLHKKSYRTKLVSKKTYWICSYYLLYILSWIQLCLCLIGICADRMIDCDDLAINGICDSEDAYTHCRLTCGGCSVLS